MMMYKVFSTLVKDGSVLGESILCEDFKTLTKAKEAGERTMLFPGCFYKVREYDTKNKTTIIGGACDTGKIVFESEVKPEEKEFRLLIYRVNPELWKFKDSMLFDSDKDEIAFSKWSYGGDVLDITLKVCGNASVTYNGKTYKNPSEFPMELREQIEKNPCEWLDADASSCVDAFNYFAYELNSGHHKQKISCDHNVATSDGDDILYIMEMYAMDYWELISGKHHPKYPEFTLEGYDKDHSVYELYGMFSNEKTATAYAKDYKKFLDEDKIRRHLCLDMFEPIDWLQVVNTQNREDWYWRSFLPE